MRKKHKDILRYVVLVLVSTFAYINTAQIVDYIFTHKEASMETLGALTAINSSIIGVWGYYVKKFTETKAHDDIKLD